MEEKYLKREFRESIAVGEGAERKKERKKEREREREERKREKDFFLGMYCCHLLSWTALGCNRQGTLIIIEC